MDYGLLTLLPAVVVIILAIISRRTTEPLLIGCVLSYVIIGGVNFVPKMVDSFFTVATDYDTVWLIIVCGLFGSLISLLTQSKGTHAIARFLGKICKSQKSTLFVSWILGIIIFVDDYMNILTISACTRKLADKNKTPREALAYVIDSTGAPVCVLIPLSTWAIFFAGVFYEQESVQALGYGDAIQTYIHIIPYIFYAIAALIIVPLFIFNVIPKIGMMKKAYERTKNTGAVYNAACERFNLEDDDDDNAKCSIWDFLIPVIIMIVVVLVWDDMFLALLASIISCAVLYIPRKKMTMSGFCDLWIKGFADSIPALSIILAALFMRQASSDINLPEYVMNAVQPYVNAQTFPMIAFIVVAILGFVTGSNWGIPAVCAPIIIPLGASVGADLLLVMAAIVSGGTFCSHACFYSDATVITSQVCGIENMDHVYTQLPYAIIGFVISCICFLIGGFCLA